jgi:hypothetical protein
MPPKLAELTDFASRRHLRRSGDDDDDDTITTNNIEDNTSSLRMISSPRRQNSNEQRGNINGEAARLMVPLSAQDVARTIETSRRYTSMQMLSILAFLANIAFLLLALRGYLGNGTLEYYVIILYHTKLTPAWWTFLALPFAWTVDLPMLLWFVSPYPKSEVSPKKKGKYFLFIYLFIFEKVVLSSTMGSINCARFHCDLDL